MHAILGGNSFSGNISEGELCTTRRYIGGNGIMCYSYRSPIPNIWIDGDLLKKVLEKLFVAIEINFKSFVYPHLFFSVDEQEAR